MSHINKNIILKGLYKMIPRHVDTTNAKFDYGSNQSSKANNQTSKTNNQTQPLKQKVIKSLYCECDELCYPIVYDQYDNIIGKLCPCCRK